MKESNFLKLLSISLLCGGLLSCSLTPNSSSSSSKDDGVTSDQNKVSSYDSSFATSAKEDESVESSSSQEEVSSTPEVKEELLLNSDFNSLNAWQIIPSHGCTIESLSNGNGELLLNIDNTNAVETWSTQVIQSGITLQKGKEYKIEFTIKSSISRSINFVLQSMDYADYLINEIIDLSANQEYHFTRMVTSSYEKSFLYGFLLGRINKVNNGQHEITIKNPSLIGQKVKLENEGLDGTTTAAPTTSHGRNLVWNDEFNENEVDRTKWQFEYGNGSWGWGNNEQEYYTDRKENVHVDNGSLKITALSDRYGNYNYSSTRMKTQDLYEFHYGYIEARIALPSMPGIWPAFWMLGANINEVAWPTCGEIDIMEAINDENKVYSTMHWNENGATSRGNNGVDIVKRTEYHLYAFEWTEDNMTFYLDNNVVYNFGISANNGTFAFRKDFFFLLNVAVGGNWPGYSIGNSFPQTMSVDYLRVYQ